MANNYETIDGVILAGGENSRFRGAVKANLVVGNQSIIERTIDILDTIFDTIIIVTNYPSEFEKFNHLKMVSDIYRKVGPLGGIHSAVTNSSADAVFVVASDMPNISPDMVRQMLDYYLIADCEVLIPSLDGFIEPLHAIYSCKIADRLNNYLSVSTRYAIKDFLEQVNVKYLDINNRSGKEDSFLNINTPGDLDNLRKQVNEF